MTKTLCQILALVAVVVIMSHSLRVDISKLERAIAQGFSVSRPTLTGE